MTFTIVNMAGQIVGVNKSSGDNIYGGYLYKGPMEKDETKEMVFMTHNLAAGMYLVTAWFEKCGDNGSGKGNQVFKMVII